jgi:GNAT superfamily N-acetyltransferase
MDTHAPSSAPSVRLARGSDVSAVRACVIAAFEPYIARIGRPSAPMLLDFPAVIGAGQVWIAERASGLAGVLVQYETADGFYIDTVAVITDQRGTGVGRALLVFAEEEALRRGYESIYLCTNSKMVENLQLYPKIGYVEYARQVLDGYDRVFLRKQVA